MKTGRISRLRPSLNSRALSNQSSESKTEGQNSTSIPKMKVRRSDDSFEKEADHVAAAIVQRKEIPRISSTIHTAQAKGEEEEAQTKKESLQSKDEEEGLQMKAEGKIQTKGEEEEVQTKGEEEEVQTKAQQHRGTGYFSGAITKKIQHHKGGGFPLSGRIRNFMESGFQRDLSKVRIHTGSEAESLSRNLKAQAFTVGNDIFFNRGKYDPQTTSGKKLLAHELTHTVQQKGSIHKKIQRQDDYSNCQTIMVGGGMRTICRDHDSGGMSDFRHIYNRIRARTSNKEITVIDGSDVVGWAAGATRVGEVYMSDVDSMVENVLERLQQGKITRLNILDHGNSNTIQIGNDRIGTGNLSNYAEQLGWLNGRFASGGFVHIQHCEAGQNKDLICGLAEIFGVPVYAGTGAHNPVYRFNFGDYVKCDPDGTFYPDAGRP